MTFEQFQATRRDATPEEIQELLRDDLTTKGYIYAGGLYIASTEGYEYRCEGKLLPTPGKYWLILERDEWMSDDLEDLERKLYQWGIEAGSIEEN